MIKRISDCSAVEYGDSDRLLILFSSRPAMRRDVFDYMTFVKDMPHTKLFLRDFNPDLLYHGGIGGLTDSIDETVDFLRLFIRRMRPARTTMMGISGGAYAAGLFGHLVGAEPDTRIDDIHVQSAVSYVDIDARERLGGGERFPGTFEGLVDWLKERGEEPRYTDLAKVVRDNPDAVRLMRMYCAVGDEIDVLHAKNLSDFPHVQAVPHQSDSHIMLCSRLLQEGTLYHDLDASVEDLIAEDPTEARPAPDYAPAPMGLRAAAARAG